MKEISVSQKFKVIKLFLSGRSYDEISQQVGIAKGSVVNIINEFREGYISLPPGMGEYVDSLRKLVVDMKKHDTSVAQLEGYAKLHEKLKEMGVGIEKADNWLDICQDIATSSTTNKGFIQAALELAEVTSDTGLNYTEVTTNHAAKLAASKQLDKEIGKKNEAIDHLKSQYKEEKQQAIEALDSINKATTTAQDVFQKQKKELKSQLDEYMVQNKLLWSKVNTILAVLNTELSASGLGKEDVKKVSGDIAQAGSLVAYIKQHELEKTELEAKINQLTIEHQELETSNAALNVTKSDLIESVKTKTQAEKEIINILQGEMNKLAGVEHVISCHTDMIGIARLLLTFLTTSDRISDSDIEELTRMILFIRQARIGITSDKYKFIKGSYVYECRLPPSYFASHVKYPIDTDKVRKKISIILAPLIQNEFMPRFEWDIKELQALELECIDMYGELMRLLIQQ